MTSIRNPELAFSLHAVIFNNAYNQDLIKQLYDTILTTDPSNEELIEIMTRLRVIDPAESHIAAWVRDLIRDEFDPIEGI